MIWKENKYLSNTFAFRPHLLHGNTVQEFYKISPSFKSTVKKNTPNGAASQAALQPTECI